MCRLVILVALIASTYAATISRELEGRILYGEKTTIREHPYQVSLQTQGQHRCGGSIISKDIIVTAAHCLRRIEAGDLWVRLGSTKQKYGGILIPVKAFRSHRLYNRMIKSYDVGLVKLAFPIKETSNIRFINLAQKTPAAGSKAIITGWGIYSFPSFGTSKILRKAEVEVVDNETCSSVKFKYGQRIKDTMFCAYGKGKDACDGDSGGPLVANNLLVGITSFGQGCGQHDYPGVYCDVASVHSWIVETAKTL